MCKERWGEGKKNLGWFVRAVAKRWVSGAYFSLQPLQPCARVVVDSGLAVCANTAGEGESRSARFPAQGRRIPAPFTTGHIELVRR